jgi:hypothetical protein
MAFTLTSLMVEEKGATTTAGRNPLDMKSLRAKGRGIDFGQGPSVSGSVS